MNYRLDFFFLHCLRIISKISLLLFVISVEIFLLFNDKTGNFLSPLVEIFLYFRYANRVKCFQIRCEDFESSIWMLVSLANYGLFKLNSIEIANICYTHQNCYLISLN